MEEKDTKKVECTYIDGVIINSGAYDFTLLGLRAIKDIDEKGNLVESKVPEIVSELRMSPELAKALYDVFRKDIDIYSNPFVFLYILFAILLFCHYNGQ